MLTSKIQNAFVTLIPRYY